MDRRTKIVATLGPATRSEEGIADLLAAGADVFRLNFAHATPEQHEVTARLVRKIARDAGKVVGILVDLPGPKMRTGPVLDDRVALVTGDSFVLTGDDVTGDDQRVSTTVDNLVSYVQPNDEIFLADGQIVLRVEGVSGQDVKTEILRGGVLRSRKGMHLPGAERHVQAFTDEDKEALRHALGFKADFIGLSFIRDALDLQRVREELPKRGPAPLLVAKIETASALASLNEIVDEADAVMVARGDLGIQTRLERVPVVQKQIIRACNRAGVPVITATQMLESMTRDPLPTRAEVADVANAVLDGTDALMLSEETAVGEHPVSAVRTMARIAIEAESQIVERTQLEDVVERDDRVSWAVAHAAVEAAEDLQVAAILCPTRSGATARRVAAFRPSMPIVGVSSRPETLGELALVWGVMPIAMPARPEIVDEEVVEHAVSAATDSRLISKGDLIAVVAGSPGPRAGQTDFVRIVRA
jgi:pyruvate kinase